MRRFASIVGLILFGAVGRAEYLVAQRPDRGIVEVGSSSRASTSEYGGFYATFGVGAGRETYRYSDEPKYTEPLTKPTLTVRIGGTPSARTRVGAEVFMWRNGIDGGYESFATYMMTGQLFIGKKGGLHVRGGAGFARSGTSYDAGGSAYETGFAYSYGAGIDLHAGRNIFITPTIEWYHGSFAKRNEPTITEHVLNFGVQVTVQTGNKR